MKPFNLERALAGDAVITRDGKTVKDLHFFKETSQYSIAGVINHVLCTFTREGKYSDCGMNHSFDLFMASKKVKGYIAIYKKPSPGDSTIFATSNLHLCRDNAERIWSCREDYIIKEVEIEI